MMNDAIETPTGSRGGHYMKTQQTTTDNISCHGVFVSHRKTCVVEVESRTGERRSRGGVTERKMDRNTNIRKLESHLLTSSFVSVGQMNLLMSVSRRRGNSLLMKNK